MIIQGEMVSIWNYANDHMRISDRIMLQKYSKDETLYFNSSKKSHCTVLQCSSKHCRYQKVISSQIIPSKINPVTHSGWQTTFKNSKKHQPK